MPPVVSDGGGYDDAMMLVTAMPLSDSLLQTYIDTFFGYGNAGDWWLVGMEEGGGNTIQEVETRLALWDSRGHKELEDVSIFSSFPALAKWFTPRPPLQVTWRGLIRLILAAEARSTDTESARAYQGTALGRTDGNNCLLELLPLPFQSVGHWIDGDHSSLPELRDRESYVRTVAPARVRHIRERIRQHRPRALVFYSRAYQTWWEQIADASFGPPVEPGVHIIRSEGTLFVVTMHPTYRGVTSEYFVRAGSSVRGLLEQDGP